MNIFHQMTNTPIIPNNITMFTIVIRISSPSAVLHTSLPAYVLSHFQCSIGSSSISLPIKQVYWHLLLHSLGNKIKNFGFCFVFL